MSSLKLKNKILKINSYSILLILIVFSVISFLAVYFVLDDTYKKEIKLVKSEYISSQKLIIKNQVNNFINFINHTKKVVKKDELGFLEKNVNALSHILTISNPEKFYEILNTYKSKNDIFRFGLSDNYGNLIYTTAKDFSKKRRLHLINMGVNKIIIHKTFKGIKYSYIIKFKNKINNKIYIIGSAIYEKNIDKIVKSIIIDRINSIKFGAKNNGYLSIAKILNYKGGDGFAKVIALPVKPSWVGKLLNEDKKDAKGKKYRKEYLKIANTTGEGYVSYWFFKKKTNQFRPKLSYVKLYKPYNWLIFTSVYIDDVKNVISQKDKVTKNEIRLIFIFYTIFAIFFLIIGYIISIYENKVLQKIINNYEELINTKNNELLKVNKNLEKEVEEKTEKLLDSLLKDILTNLPNREKLLLDIKDKNIYIAILNIDSFKEINDFYGLEIGDKVLKKLATILQNSIIEDTYKLSSDEFAIVTQDLEILKIKIGDLIYILANTSIKVENENINISVSCGIGESITKADMALKYSKQHKAEKIVIFNNDLSIVKEYENNLKWKKIIHKAIHNDKILPFVQPIINNETQKVEKYECLVRLENEGEIYSPYFFLEISKHTTQYQEIQKIMVKKSFQKFSKLDCKFSINLSTIDLTNSSFKEFLLIQIEKYKVENKVIIELLEDENLLKKDILEFLQLLKSKNIAIAIDDFGSGYSNFSYLIKDIPVSILKIDGSLVKNIAKNERDYKLFVSIVNMAKEFDFQIVAEFVETKEIAEILRNLKIKYSQGYYFSKPFDMRVIKNGTKQPKGI